MAVVQMATRRTHEVNAPPAMMARVKGTPRSDSKFETIETATGLRVDLRCRRRVVERGALVPDRCGGNDDVAVGDMR